MQPLQPLDVRRVNDMFRPNSPWDWAVIAGQHGQHSTLVAVGYGPAPKALRSDDETLLKVHNQELEHLKGDSHEDPQVRA